MNAFFACGRFSVIVPTRNLFEFSVAFATSVLLFVWIIPAVIGQPFLRLYLLAEHGRELRVACIARPEIFAVTFGHAAWYAS